MKRQLKVVVASLLAVGLLATAACGDDDDDATGDKSGTTVKIGAQDFGESAILAEIYKQALEADGFKADIQTLGGYRDLLFAAFDSGDVNLAPEYLASELEYLNEQAGKPAGEASSDVDETLGKLEPMLEEEGLVAFEPSDAVDTNSFVMTKEKSDELGITSLSDLAEKGEGLKLGAPQNCEENAFCLPGLKEVYGLDLTSGFIPLDAAVIGTTLSAGEIDVALLFSTDGRIADEDWVLLDDDKKMLAADNVLPVATKALSDEYGEDLSSLLDKISGELTTEDLIELNKRYDIDREDAKDIAADWLSDHDLG
jgi:osmoprotectant transport system substrate-binding protein